MLGMTHIRPHSAPGRLIAVRFTLFEDGQTLPLVPEEREEASRERVLPRLVTRAFIDRIPEDTPFPHRPLGDTGLFVAYVEDGEHTVRYVMSEMVDELGLSEYELYELALENLAQSCDMEAVVRRALAEPAITAVKTMDSFDAVRLLLIPTALQPGEALVALVPDRDTLTLLPVPEEDWTTIAELAKVPASDHLLIDRPLLVTRDGFEVR
jgi:hypothetical protein